MKKAYISLLIGLPLFARGMFPTASFLFILYWKHFGTQSNNPEAFQWRETPHLLLFYRSDFESWREPHSRGSKTDCHINIWSNTAVCEACTTGYNINPAYASLPAPSLLSINKVIYLSIYCCNPCSKDSIAESTASCREMKGQISLHMNTCLGTVLLH